MRYNACRTTIAAAAGMVLMGAPLSAGGYLNISSVTGNPIKWSGTVTINTDLGTLGSLSNSQANTLVQTALEKWNTAAISESSLSFSIGTQLPQDNTGASFPTNCPQYSNTGDSFNAVIYDTDGTITDGALGSGASNSVVGFAGIQNFFPATDTVAGGQAVLNGKFIDGAGSPSDITQSQYEGVMAHEFGHFLNLDHAQINESSSIAVSPGFSSPTFEGMPTMYPNVHGGIATLEKDDKVWISRLYPTAAFNAKTKITGTVTGNSGALVNGINIICRAADDPLATAVSCVSGFLDLSANTINASANEATFEIPGLEPNKAYTLEFEQIKPSFLSGSRVGPLSAQLDLDAVGLPEFINESGTETNSDSATRSTSFVTPNSAGGTLSGVNLTLNTVPSDTAVAEVDTGGGFPSSAQTINLLPAAPLVISGSTSMAETTGSFGVSDWYQIIPAAGLEIYETVLTPVPGLDVNLYIVSFDQANAQIFAPAVFSSGGAGVAETTTNVWDSTRFGSGTAAGRIYLGVRPISGSGNYTLRISAKPATRDVMVVSGVSGTFDVNTGSVTILGQGFKNTGGAPTVTFSSGNITPGTVTFVNSGQINVAVTKGGGFVNPTTTDVTVTNQSAGGGYSAKRLSLTAVPVSIAKFEAE